MVPFLVAQVNSIVQKRHYTGSCEEGSWSSLELFSLTRSVGDSVARGLPLPPWVCVVFLPPPVLVVSALWHDLKSGFYKVVRGLVVRLQSSGEDIERVIESISAPAQLEDALLRLMAEPSIVERHNGDSHLSALLSEAHTT